MAMFCQSKFYPLFSLLFGIGAMLQRQSVITRGGSFSRLGLRRMAFLALFGVGHIVFLWYGDILLVYATAGAALVLLSGLRARIKIVAGVGLLILSALSIGTLTGFGAGSSTGSAVEVLEAATAVELGERPFTEVFGQFMELEGDVAHSVYVAGETKAYAEGGFVQALGFRAVSYAMVAVAGALGVWWAVLGLFLLGAGLFESGLFDPAHERRLLAAVAGAMVVGLPLSALVVLTVQSDEGSALGFSLAMGGTHAHRADRRARLPRGRDPARSLPSPDRCDQRARRHGAHGAHQLPDPEPGARIRLLPLGPGSVRTGPRPPAGGAGRGAVPGPGSVQSLVAGAVPVRAARVAVADCDLRSQATHAPLAPRSRSTHFEESQLMLQRSVAFAFFVFLGSAVAPSVATAENGTTEFDQGRVVTEMPHVLPQRDRPAVINRMVEDRLDNLLPRLMRETGIDMWLVINREYAEDPVYFTLVPHPVHAARRTTMLVFFDRGEEGVERLTVNRYPFRSMYESAWSGGNLDEQWQGLAEVIGERNPKKIGINVSRTWPPADGLTASLRDRLMEELSPELRSRVVSAEELAIRWLETRSELELATYPHIVQIARAVIDEAFSERVITPGATTAGDVAWYIAERFAELELPIWFQPSVDIQRKGQNCTGNAEETPFCGAGGNVVVMPGDVLHTDVGVCYLLLCTDTQEMGYVLRPDENDVPEELQEALAAGNLWQDMLTTSYETGRTGNQVLARTNAQCEREGIICSTYTHPIGFFGHAPGPTIGMWDNQGPTPERGDWAVFPNTAYSIEGNARVPLEMWDEQYVVIKLEQDAVFDGEGVWYLAGRQTEWLLVR